MKPIRLLSLAVVLAVAAGCSSCESELDRLQAELSDPSAVKRAGAARILWKVESQRAYQLANLALQDRSSVVRTAAVRALGDFKRIDTTNALIRAVKDADPEVVREAVLALGKRFDDRVAGVLLDVLDSARSGGGVKETVLDVLRRNGLTMRLIGDRLAAKRLERILRQWPDAGPARRAALVRQAGRLALAEGLDVVLDGLEQDDDRVVVAALEVLDGRGDGRALKRLVMLSSSELPEIRRLVARQLASHGSEGISVLWGMVNDPDPGVRLAVLGALMTAGEKLPAAPACELLLSGEDGHARKALELLSKSRLTCSGMPVGKVPPRGAATDRLLRLFLEYESAAARRTIGSLLAVVEQPQRPIADAASVWLGRQEKAASARIAKELGRKLVTCSRLLESWPKDKLAPQSGERQGSEKRGQQLDDEELRELYERHGMKLRPGAPRSVADILSRFRPPDMDESYGLRIFDPLGNRLRLEILMLLFSLDKLDRANAEELARRFFELGDPELSGRIAAHFGPAYGKGWVGSCQVAAKLLASAPAGLAGGPMRLLLAVCGQRYADSVCKTLKSASLRKREEMLNAATGRVPECMLQLAKKFLKGESVAAAARMLARVGTAAALPALQKVLQTAGPAARLIVLEELARLGDDTILPRLEKLLLDPEPSMRLRAIRLLARLGTGRARKALERAMWDPDRLVRRLARRELEGENGHGKGKTEETERRGRKVP
ncbi:MAG: HEAT repeat domain-containing protein [Deltaproteobacteria bacterium]|nr:MAG: HEAT repeat domain-containing protein [Deltaproteobacteria bacterium]